MSVRVALPVIACWAGVMLGTVGTAESAPSGTTKLVRGPIAFRLTGYQDAPSSTSLGDYRYAIVFKLSRDPQGRLPDTSTEQGHGTTRGSFALDGYEAEVSHLYSPAHAPEGASLCFVGYIDDENPEWLRKERRTPLGAAVRVTLRPLTRRADGTNAYGSTMTRRPHLQQADVALKSSDARRRLRRIGC